MYVPILLPWRAFLCFPFLFLILSSTPSYCSENRVATRDGGGVNFRALQCTWADWERCKTLTANVRLSAAWTHAPPPPPPPFPPKKKKKRSLGRIGSNPDGEGSPRHTLTFSKSSFYYFFFFSLCLFSPCHILLVANFLPVNNSCKA